MEHSIAEVAMKFRFSRKTFSRVYREYRKSALPKTAANFNAGQVSLRELFHETSYLWAFGAEGPLVYPCFLDDIKFYASSGPVNTDIGLWMTENTLPGMTSFISNSIEGRVWVWRQPRESMDPTGQQGTVQVGGGFVMKRSPPPLTPTDLWTALQNPCCQLPPALIQTLIESMPCRVEALLFAREPPRRYYTDVPVFLALKCTKKTQVLKNGIDS
ncbi:uncharacterized protein TNCV_370411 [Trichonephila clavipes]|nr:uncharacterized protein TNCV_370411 [Trichonephila clavipes]